MTTSQKSCPIFLAAFDTFCDPHSSIFSFVHELFPTKEHSFVVLVRYLFLNHIFFHALRLPYVFFCLLYSCRHVVSKDGKPVKRWARHQLADLVSFPVSHYLHVHAAPQVFHRFPKHRVVHQLVEVQFKIAFCLLAKLHVHPDVWLHPQLLIKLYHSVAFPV